MRERKQQNNVTISQDNMSALISGQQEHPEPLPDKVIVKCSFYVYILNKPKRGPDGMGVAIARDGEEFNVIGEDGDFYEIEFAEDRTGYIKKRYCVI